MSGISTRINILITSPVSYSKRFSDVFSGSHLNPVAIPMIETVIPENRPDMNRLFTNIHRFEYIAFSSRNAIESFYRLQSKRNRSLKGIKFCAIGKDTDYMVEKLGVHPAVHPDEPSPMGIAGKLGEDKNILGKTIAALVPSVEGIEEPDVVPDFLAELSGIGMNVTRVDAYITRPVDKISIERAVKLITLKKIQCIAFTSSAEVEILLQNTADKGLLESIAIACFGPYTAAYAQKRGLPIAIIAKDFSSFSGFLKAMEEYFHE